MTLVDVARRAVVRTNQWPALKTLYDQAYDLGLAFTVNRLSSVPGVLAVMLRVNEGGRAWVPGLSDYDVTVLTERHDGPRAIQFLDQIWQRYRSIKRAVPQLGEMEVMDVEEYGDFLDFGPTPTASLKHADSLFVRAGNGEVERVLQRVPRPPNEREFLLDALTRFGGITFPAWLDDAVRGSQMTRRRIDHLMGNVSKRLARLGVPAETGGTTAIADRMVMVFQAVSQACRRMKACESDQRIQVDHDASRLATHAIQPIQTFCEHALRDARVRRGSAVLWKSYMSADRVNLVFVVPDDLPQEELRRLFATLAAMNHTVPGLFTTAGDNGGTRYVPLSFPTVASDSMWKCWRELSPFDGVGMAATGRTLVGELALAQAAPSLTALKRGAEVKYASVLSLKNNWRPSNGRLTGPYYSAYVNHVNGYASASTGRVLTMPAALDFTATEDGHPALVDAVKKLRASLAN